MSDEPKPEREEMHIGLLKPIAKRHLQSADRMLEIENLPACETHAKDFLKVIGMLRDVGAGKTEAKEEKPPIEI